MSFIDSVVDDIPNVSIITKIEVLSFNAADEHYALLNNFMNDATVIDLTYDVVMASIEIRKKYKTKLPDAIIAATAVVYNLSLISHNTSDFKNIEGLKVFDPHNL
ncbi:MAG: type II toxin-antitoxin system VapC family toxin [Bacteroidota bacterium]|nr:type II toxin-antitoxin system VapC family toxin [Bacteroidota bacterium]